MNRNIILNSFIECSTLNSLVEEVSNTLKCPIIITDISFHIVAAFSHAEYFEPTYKKAIMHSELSYKSCFAITSAFESNNDDRIWLLKNGHKYCVSELVCQGIKSGYIIYIFKNKKESIPKNEDLYFVEALISKQLYFESHSENNILSNAEEILTRLLNGDIADEKHFDLQKSGTYLAHFSPKRFGVIEFADSLDYDEKKERLLKNLNQIFHASHPFFYHRRIVFFIHEDHDINYLNELEEKYSLNIVISGILENLYDIKNEYSVICNILKYKHIKNDNHFIIYEENYYLLMVLYKLKEHKHLIDKNILKINEYDIKNNTEFCITLYYYLITNHSLKATSQILYTHSNTVFYRIQKLKNDFLIDIDNYNLHFTYLLSLALVLLSSGYDELFIKK